MSPAVLRLPVPFRRFASGRAKLQVSVGSLREALRSAFAEHGALERQIVDHEFLLRSFVRVFVDGRDCRELDGLETRIEPGARVAVVPVVAGCVRGHSAGASAPRVNSCWEL